MTDMINDFLKAGKIDLRHQISRILLVFSAVVFLSLFAGIMSAVEAYADTGKTDIRVGLECLYHNKSIITVYNERIKIGYCKNDSYKAELVLKSGKGFSFEPEKKTYYYSNEIYSSYNKAYLAAQNMMLDGVSPLICMCGRSSWRLYVPEGYRNKTGASIKASNTELVRLSFGKKVILIDASYSGAYPQIAAYQKKETISLGSRDYRGRIEIGHYGDSGLTAVNVINIESYLKGVVTCEMISSWHPEALKVQAVCARSYAMTKCSFKSDCSLSKPYQIIDTSASQVYGGAGKETAASIRAVNATKKMILCSQGKPVITYYFSTSGGATEFSSDVWGGNSFNYVGVFDEYETNPERAPWIVKYTYAEVEQMLNRKGYSISGITEIYPEVLSDSGRVGAVRVKSAKKSITVPGSKIKSVFDLNSTKFRIVTSKSDELFSVELISDGPDSENTVSNFSDIYTISGDGKISEVHDEASQLILITDDNMINFPLNKPPENEIWFLGMGWGHGIGMSQSGANGMAKKGFDFKEILYYYFKNTELSTY